MLKKLINLSLFVSLCVPFAVNADWIQFDGYSSLRLPTARGTEKEVQPEIITKNEISTTNSNELVVTMTIKIPGLFDNKVTRDSMSFSDIKIPGWPSQGFEFGKPAVPSKEVYIPIAPGYTIKNVQIIKEIKVSLSNINVVPSQPPVPTLQNYTPEFVMDKDAYQVNAFYPESSIMKSSIVKMRDKNFLVINATPVRVNPKTQNAVVVTELNVQATLVKEITESRSLAPTANGTFTPRRYMILMDDQFVNNPDLNTFIDWKIRKGNNVLIVTTSQINPNGAPDSLEIRNFMRTLPSNEYPNYLLIIGNETAANGVKGWGYWYDTVNIGYTDLYYACRDGSDDYADLSYGRLPATNNDSLSLMIRKVYEADVNPWQSQWPSRISTSGTLETMEHKGLREEIGFLTTVDAVSSYFEQVNLGVNSYTVTRATTNPDSAKSGCFWNGDLWYATTTIGSRITNSFLSDNNAIAAMKTSFNSGVTLHFHYSHGGYNGWASPLFVTEDVRGLSNGNRRPLVISLGCLTGEYQMPYNFTNEWLLHKNGGAYAVISSTNVAFSYYSDWFGYGMMVAHFPYFRTWQNQSTNPDWDRNIQVPMGFTEGTVKNLGELVNAGKIYSIEHCGPNEDIMRNYQLFGDPESDIQIDVPVIPTISHPATISKTASSITINTERVGVLVCLYSAAMGLHKAEYVTGTPSITFPVSNLSSGIINVTVTGSGIRPYTGTIQVDFYNLTGVPNPVIDTARFTFTVNDASLVGKVATLTCRQNGAVKFTQTKVMGPGLNGVSMRFNQYNPLQAGQYKLCLSINGADVDSINFTKVDKNYLISASPATLAFGQISSSSSKTMNVTLTNTGNSNAIVSGMNFSRGTPFTHNAVVPFTITPGTSKVITITFTSNTNGTYKDTLQIINAPDQLIQVLNIEATGTVAVSSNLAVTMVPDANVTGNSISPQIVIKNNGTSSINLSDLAVEYYSYDPNAVPSNLRADIYYCSAGGTVTPSFSRISPVKGNATYKADLVTSFTFSTGALTPAQSVQFNFGLHSADWSYNFNENDDWSHVAGASNAAQYILIRNRSNGAILYGTAP